MTARRAPGAPGRVYVSLAVLGEAFLLMGFVLLAAATPGGSLLIRDAVAALPASPWRESTLLLLILGFGLKIGLVPLHVWMPLAYPAAPIPAAAVLSGAAVKAGVIGLIRFLPLDAALPDWGGWRWPPSGCSRRSTASRSASPRPTRRRCWPIPASARWA